MSAKPEPSADPHEIEFELVDIADLPEEEWDDELREAVAYADAHPDHVIPHAEVMEWVSRWGTPMPEAWRKR